MPLVQGPIEQVLEKIRDALVPFVERTLDEYYRRHGKDWFTEVNKKRPKRIPLRRDPQTGAVYWSPDDLLNTMALENAEWDAFQNSFKTRSMRPVSPGDPKFPDFVAKGWIEELMEIRRRAAHQEPLTQYEIGRFFETAELLLRGAGADAPIDDLRKIRPASTYLLPFVRNRRPRKVEPIALLKPNASAKRMLSMLPLESAEKWKQTTIDGAIEIFSCPDGSSRYGGLEFDHIICDTLAKEWPEDFGSLEKKKSEMLAAGLIGDDQYNIKGWLTQKGTPERIRVLAAPVDPPVLDRRYVQVQVGNSDYFAPRTITNLFRSNVENRGPDLYSIFAESWAKPGTEFTTKCIPYHVSVQGIVISRTPERDYLLLASINPNKSSISIGWGATMAEQMWAPDVRGLATQWWQPYAHKHLGNIPVASKRDGDADLRETLRRGLKEELDIRLGADTIQNPRLLNVAIEENFFVTFIFIVIVGLEPVEIWRRWMKAPDHSEMGLLAAYQFRGLDSAGEMLEGPKRFAELLAGEQFDAGPHLLPEQHEKGAIVGPWHCSSRLRIYAAGMHLWPEEFPNYVRITN